jgi:hypothetical protein
MKKVLGVAAFAVLGVVALSSCKKDYTCTVSGVVLEYNDFDKTQADAQKTACTLAGGTWSSK